VTEDERVEDAGTNADGKPPEGGLGCRTCSVGCLGILILGGLGVGLMTANAGGRLDARVSEVSQEILDLQDSADHRRSTILGAPENDQNALADYQGFMWVLAAGRSNDLPLSWREGNRPLLPEDVDDMAKRVAPKGQGMDPVAPAYLAPVLEPHFDLESMEPGRKKQLLASAKLYKRFRPALRYIRDGLSRGKCDWQVVWEKGANLEIPNLMALRAAGTLMAYEASQQPPAQALQTGLEIVAFGQDCARHGSIIGAMIGVAISHIGYQSLARTFERPGLEASDYQRAIDALASYQVPSTEELLRAERISMTVTMLQMSGRSVDQSSPVTGTEGVMGFGPGSETLLTWDVVQARELDGYERFHERGVELARLPHAERRQRALGLEAELEEEHYLIANALYVNVDSCVNQLEQSYALARVVRTLAAAHQVRVRTGAFPQRIQSLANLLGEGVADPTSDVQPAVLGYGVQQGYVRCWIAGENGVDDGGPELKLPRPKRTASAPGKKKRKSRNPRPRSGVGGGGDDMGFQSMAPPAAAPKPVSSPGQDSEAR